MTTEEPSRGPVPLAHRLPDAGLVPETAAAESARLLRALVPDLICPACGAALALEADELVGVDCAHRYPVREGIAELAVAGGAETWGAPGARSSSAPYQRNYQRVEAAADYNQSYAEKPLKRLSTTREHALLRRLLASQGHSPMLLNLPCGGGRLSRPLADMTDLLLEADIGVGQLRYGAAHRDWQTPEIRLTASAFHVPLRDRAVTGSVCIRLCHHLPTAEERHRLLDELLRVSERFVLMTFFDFRSLKNLIRRAQRKPPKHTMRVEEVEDVAARQGFALVACLALSVVGSGHRYALLRRRRTDA